MDKMFKIRYESAKQDTIDFKKEIYNMKTFYTDDPNLSDRDTYKLDFVKKERWVDNHNADYTVKSDGAEGQNHIQVKNGGSTEDGTIRRRMSK